MKRNFRNISIKEREFKCTKLWRYMLYIFALVSSSVKFTSRNFLTPQTHLRSGSF